MLLVREMSGNNFRTSLPCLTCTVPDVGTRVTQDPGLPILLTSNLRIQPRAWMEEDAQCVLLNRGLWSVKFQSLRAAEWKLPETP